MNDFKKALIRSLKIEVHDVDWDSRSVKLQVATITCLQAL